MSTQATNPSRSWTSLSATPTLPSATASCLTLTAARPDYPALPAALRIAWELDPGALRSAGALDRFPDLAIPKAASFSVAQLEIRATVNHAGRSHSGRSHADARLIVAIPGESSPREIELLPRCPIRHRLSRLAITSHSADTVHLLHLDGAPDTDGTPWLRVTLLLDAPDAPPPGAPRPADLLLATTTLLQRALNLPGGVYQPPSAEAFDRA